jgi:hypothetical protein
VIPAVETFFFEFVADGGDVIAPTFDNITVMFVG